MKLRSAEVDKYYRFFYKISKKYFSNFNSAIDKIILVIETKCMRLLLFWFTSFWWFLWWSRQILFQVDFSGEYVSYLKKNAIGRWKIISFPPIDKACFPISHRVSCPIGDFLVIPILVIRQLHYKAFFGLDPWHAVATALVMRNGIITGAGNCRRLCFGLNSDTNFDKKKKGVYHAMLYFTN